jgi:hypothetical protein
MRMHGSAHQSSPVYAMCSYLFDRGQVVQHKLHVSLAPAYRPWLRW